MSTRIRPWCDGAVIYEIYPLSFYDSNGDGIGDLRGIIEKLDYLKGGAQSLNVDAIWICPFYPSAMKDHGYDITDFTSVDKRFGTMDDFKELIRKAHQRGLKIIIDLVTNHTSDKHPWFVKSKSSKSNPKRNWYIWHKGKEGGLPPNNWKAVPGGSAWQYDNKTKEYYLHQFLKEQPDLNWRNNEVYEAMKQVMITWAKLGVDGFRVDALSHVFEDPKMEDEPKRKPRSRFVLSENNDNEYETLNHVHTKDQKQIKEIIKLFDYMVMVYPQLVFFSETYVTHKKLRQYYLQSSTGHHIPFNFSLLNIKHWSANHIKLIINNSLNCAPEPSVITWILGNHDIKRLANRYGIEKSRILGALTVLLPGITFIYYGDELGMVNVPSGTHQPLKNIPHGDGFESQNKTWSRDETRSPMQWDKSENLGFSLNSPWRAYDKNAIKNATTVYDQQKTLCSNDVISLLNLYKYLISIRNQFPFIKNSRPEICTYEDELLEIKYKHNDTVFNIFCNFSEKQTAKLPQTILKNKFSKIFSSTHGIRPSTHQIKELAPLELMLCVTKN